MSPILSFECHRIAGVAALANVRIDLNLPKERKPKLLRSALSAAFGKDVDLFVALRAGEEAHVLHDANQVDFDLLEHLDSFLGVLKRYIGRRRNDDSSGQRRSLDQRNSDVA